MTIRPAPLPIQFVGGVETGVDAKQVPTTQLLDLQNCVFDKTSVLKKRNGYRALNKAIQNAGGDIANARDLGQRDGEVLLFTDKRCYSYRPSADRWADTGEVAATTLTTLPMARTGTFQTQPDVAERNGIRAAAWEDSRGGVWCSVFESETDRVLLSQRQLDSSASALNPRCIAVGEVIHVLWTRADLGTIQIAIVNPATPSLDPVVSTLTGDLNTTNPFFDAEACIDGPSGTIGVRPGIIAWANAGVGWRVGYISPDGTLGSPLTGLPSVYTFPDSFGVFAGPISVAADPSADRVAVIWVDRFGPGTQVSLDILTSSTLTPLVVIKPVASALASVYARVSVAWGGLLSSGAPFVRWIAETAGARTDLCSLETGAYDLGPFPAAIPQPDLPRTLLGHSLVSRAFRDGEDVYVLVAHSVRFFPYVVALRLGEVIRSPSSVIVSRIMPGEASGSLMRVTGPGTRAWTKHLPSVISVGLGATDLRTRQHAAFVPYRIQLSSENGDQFSEQGLKLCTLDFDVRYPTVQFGRGLYLASSAPMHYDGEAWHEADFHCAPDYGFDATGAPVALSGAVAIGGAGNIGTGTFLYAYWYEAIDAQGELHRGPVNKFLATMVGGPKTFVHSLPTCRLTRFSNVRICVARTVQGATGTDSTLELFRVTSTDVTVSTGSNRYVLNDPLVDTVSFTDDLSDALLISREPLYTNGGILSNSPAPWAGGVIATGKSRLYWTDPTDPQIVRYSQELQDDTALEAPVDLSIRVDPFGGPVKAIAVMDSAVYPLCETAIYVFGGIGPARDGGLTSSDGFSAAELVTSDAGCSSPGSVCDTPVGVMFQSSKGVVLLDRGRQMRDIGNPVSAYDGQTIRRMTLLPDRQSIIALTDSGRTLLWDYRRVQWSTFTNHEGLDAVVVDGVYHYLRNDSRVFRETIGAYRDDNSQIPMLIETAWIHFAPYLQGWQRILWAYFLGSYRSAHTLSVRYRLDYNDGYSSPILCDVNANYNPSAYGAGLYGAGAYSGAGGSGTRYQRRIHLNKRCQAISFRIEDVQDTDDYGASFELTELLLIGGGIGPAFKPGAARTGIRGA